MKLILHQVKEGEDEVIITYQSMTDEVARVIAVVQNNDKKLMGYQDRKQFLMEPNDVLYAESVDGSVYAYTADGVFRIDYTLAELEGTFPSVSYFRCSKSMVINVWRVQSLKSMSGNRIDARLLNGEHVVISRKYATEFRKILKGGRADE